MAEKPDKKPAAKVKLKPTSHTWKNYDKGKKKNKTCPKCGPSVFMANHKTRITCGKCGYMEKVMNK